MTAPESFIAFFQNGPGSPICYRVGVYLSEAIAQVAADDAVRYCGTVDDAAGWVNDHAPEWASQVVHELDPEHRLHKRPGQLRTAV